MNNSLSFFTIHSKVKTRVAKRSQSITRNVTNIFTFIFWALKAVFYNRIKFYPKCSE